MITVNHHEILYVIYTSTHHDILYVRYTAHTVEFFTWDTQLHNYTPWHSLCRIHKSHHDIFHWRIWDTRLHSKQFLLVFIGNHKFSALNFVFWLLKLDYFYFKDIKTEVERKYTKHFFRGSYITFPLNETFVCNKWTEELPIGQQFRVQNTNWYMDCLEFLKHIWLLLCKSNIYSSELVYEIHGLKLI